MARVIVLDDEPELLEVVCLTLEDSGHVALGIGHPNVLLELDIVPRPDMLLIDLMLPSMDGIELAGRLRQGHFPYTPMVAISASSEMIHRAELSGLFQSTLRKPFDIEALIWCVEQEIETLQRNALQALSDIPPGTG